jgi:hypothetical protein
MEPRLDLAKRVPVHQAAPLEPKPPGLFRRQAGPIGAHDRPTVVLISQKSYVVYVAAWD